MIHRYIYWYLYFAFTFKCACVLLSKESLYILKDDCYCYYYYLFFWLRPKEYTCDSHSIISSPIHIAVTSGHEWTERNIRDLCIILCVIRCRSVNVQSEFSIYVRQHKSWLKSLKQTICILQSQSRVTIRVLWARQMTTDNWIIFFFIRVPKHKRAVPRRPFNDFR